MISLRNLVKIFDSGADSVRAVDGVTMDAVDAGREPIGTIRDQAKNRIVDITPGEFKIGSSKSANIKRKKPCCHATRMTC